MDSSSSLPDPFPAPSASAVSGSLRPPSSKSVSLRALNLALIGGRRLEIRDLLIADDTRYFLVALETLGWTVEEDGGVWVLEPPSAPVRSATIDCGESGTMMRFLIAAMSTMSGRWRLDGRSRLRERPVGALVDTLRRLGADIAYLGQEGCAPLQVEGGSLEGGEVEVAASESSQYVSALAMAALRASGPIGIRVTSLTSAPYVDLTVSVLREAGADVRVTGAGLSIHPGNTTWDAIGIEGDFSAAAYPAAAAVLIGGLVELEGLERTSAQGDARFLDLLVAVGAEVSWHENTVQVLGTGTLRGLEVDLSRMPDQVPTLAAMAPFLEGETRIRNVAHLRIKESDRLHAMAVGLESLGVPVRELDDGLVVEGVWAQRPPPDSEVTVNPFGDHRIAMSMALAGLRRPGVRIADPGVVGKSYPGFWKDWEGLISA